jgi:long-chain acyl-CoA synthetase
VERLDTLQTLIDRLGAHGERPCLLVLQAEGLQTWTYARLSDEVGRLAAGLIAAGVGRGEPVALLSKNRPEWLIACLAILAAGAAVSPLDSQISTEALAHVLRDSGTRLIFTTTEYLNRVNKSGATPPQAVLLDVADDDSRGWRAMQRAALGVAQRVSPDDQAALFYTSGTTGVPKGVPLTHRNLAFQIDSLLQSGVVGPQDSALAPLPFYHVYPFATMLIPLALASYLVLPAGMTGPQLVRAIKEGRPTVLIGVPRLYRALYTGIEANARAGGGLARAYFDNSLRLSIWLRRRTGWQIGRTLLAPIHKRMGGSLRLLCSGGSALDPDIAEKLDGLGWQIAVGYGLTETSPLLTINTPNSGKLASAGTALPGVELRLAPLEGGDADENRGAASEGDDPPEGEVQARGPNVFAGYRNLPDATAAAFTPDGWFRTGDLGFFDADGYLYVTGRANTLIVTESGKKIQPDPLEEIYCHHPLFEEVGVLKAPDAQLAAVIVPNMDEVNRRANGNVAVGVKEALAELLPTLPSHQRVTDYVVSLDPLQKTNLGKLRRQQLKELYGQLKQGIAATGTAAGPVAIQDMSEADQALLEHPAALQVWELFAERYHDRALTPDSSPALELGIDSLAWLNLTLEISERTGVELGDEAVARIATLRDLLREVTAEPAEQVQLAVLEHPETVLSAEELRWLRPQGWLLRQAHMLVMLLNHKLMRWCFRLKTVGVENVPREGQIVFTPNHQSYLDVTALAASLPYGVLARTCWAGSSDVVFVNPAWRLLSRVSRTVPIARYSGTGQKSLAMGAAVLKQGNNLVWFPEGKLSISRELLPFRQGLGMVLEQHPVSVVPVLIEGTPDALPPDNSRLRFRPIRVTFGKPMQPSELVGEGEGASDAARMMDALHGRVAALKAPQAELVRQ